MQNRFASIRVDAFPLHAVVRLSKLDDTAAVAIVDDIRMPGRVFCCSATAQSYGVRRGMTLAQALGRCSRLQIFPRSSAAESSADRILRDAAWALSPTIELLPGCGYRMDLAGQQPERWQRRAESVLTQLRTIGLPARIGVAATPDLADMAAMFANPLLRVNNTADFLRTVTIDAAPIAPELKAAFILWGLHNLEDVLRISQDELANRLGAQAAELWDCLSARNIRPLQALVNEVSWEEYTEPEYPLETVDSLLFLLRSMLVSIHLRLTANCKVVRQLHIALHFEDHSIYTRYFQLPQAAATLDSLFSLLANHLRDLRASAPITAVRIKCDPVDPFHRQPSFFQANLRNPARFADTLAQLVGIAGNQHVGSPRMTDSHRDDTWILQSLPETLPVMDSSESERKVSFSNSTFPLPSPILALRRQRPPLPATVITAEEHPVHLYSSRYSGPISACRGPWQSSGHWWTSNPWHSEEWDIKLEDGPLCRIHREKDRWWIDGTYD